MLQTQILRFNIDIFNCDVMSNITKSYPHVLSNDQQVQVQHLYTLYQAKSNYSNN